MYAQTIDDVKGVTLAEAHGTDSVKVGTEIAKKMVALKINSVVFDRNGYIYHGRVKQLADAAREGGLVF
jgi:large subunit ribosomal protein L18